MAGIQPSARQQYPEIQSEIGIVEYFDTVKQENTKESGKKNE